MRIDDTLNNPSNMKGPCMELHYEDVVCVGQEIRHNYVEEDAP